MEKDVDEEEEEEGDGVEDQDVGDVSDVRFGEELDLFFGGAHEEESGGEEEEWWEVLKRVWFGKGGAVAKHEADFDDTSCARGHEGIAEDTMDHSAEFDFLRVGAHCPACHKDYDPWEEVSAWSSSAVTAKPYAHEAGTPPDNAHACML